MPTVINSTIAGSSPDYATPALWESDTDNDLVTLDEQHNGQLQVLFDMGSDTLILFGGTTDSTRYRNLTFGGSGVRYDPIADSGSGLTTSGGRVIRAGENYSKATGIHIKTTTTALITCIGNADPTNIFDGCTLRNSADDNLFAYWGDGTNLWNCVFFSRGPFGAGIRFDSAADISVLNCVIYPVSGQVMERGIWITVDDVASTVIRNTICMNSTATDFKFDGVSSNGTYSNNISSDATAPGSGSFINQTDTDIFTAPGSDDFTLVSSGNAVDNGVDLSGTFTLDLAGTTRTTPWDIGTYDFVAVTNIIQIINEVAQLIETAEQHRAITAIADEVAQLIESTEQHRAITAIANEVSQIVETTLRSRVMARVLDEVVQLVEGTEQHRAITAIANEVAQIVEGVEQHRAIVQLIFETVNIPETVAEALSILFIQIINETLQIPETVSQNRSITQIVSEILQIVETILRPRTMVRTLDESISIVEAAIAARAMIRVISETLQIIEVTVTKIQLAGSEGPLINVDVPLATLNVDVTLATLNADVGLATLNVDVTLATLNTDVGLAALNIDVNLPSLGMEIAT